MSDPTLDPQSIHNALGHLPSATFVLTCCHGQYRDGIITRWVQQCSDDPPMLVVAIKKGQAIEPMLRDARAFALCMVLENDRQALRLFGNDHDPEDDPFLSISTTSALTGMPILENAIAWFDCKLEGHLSPDADCRLYLGHVIAATLIHKKRMTSKGDLPVSPPTHRTPSSRAPSLKETSKTTR